MRTFSKTASVLLGAGVLVSMMVAPTVAVATGPVSVTSSNVNVTITGGPISATTTGATLAAVTLTGADQHSTGLSTPWTLTDARGTGVNWTLSATATPFTSVAGTGAGAVDLTDRVISASNLSISTGAITALGTSDSAPAPLTIASMSSTSQLLVDATSKKGSYSVAPSTFDLTVPANAYRSNHSGDINSPLTPYVSVVTLTIG